MDVRDLRGRLQRFAFSMAVGILVAGALAYVIPNTSTVWPHWESCFDHPGKVILYDLPLIGSGAFAIALGCNALLAVWARRLRLPTMRVVR